jgi:hypothetical protein
VDAPRMMSWCYSVGLSDNNAASIGLAAPRVCINPRNEALREAFLGCEAGTIDTSLGHIHTAGAHCRGVWHIHNHLVWFIGCSCGDACVVGLMWTIHWHW